MTHADCPDGLAFSARELEDELALVLCAGLKHRQRCADEAEAPVHEGGLRGRGRDGDRFEEAVEVRGGKDGKRGVFRERHGQVVDGAAVLYSERASMAGGGFYRFFADVRRPPTSIDCSAPRGRRPRRIPREAGNLRCAYGEGQSKTKVGLRRAKQSRIKLSRISTTHLCLPGIRAAHRRAATGRLRTWFEFIRPATTVALSFRLRQAPRPFIC